MLEAALLASPWPGVGLALAMYLLTYGLALYEAHLYYRGADQVIVYAGGYPLAREYDAARRQRGYVLGRQAAVLLALAAGMAVVWELALQRFGQPALYLALLGGVLLMELAEVPRRLRAAVLFQQVVWAGSVSGKLTLGRRALLTARFVEYYVFAAVYGLAFFVAGSWFFAGGALACLVAANRQRDWVIVRE